MVIFLASSKTMTDDYGGINIEPSIPQFQTQVSEIAGELNGYSVSELQSMLKINSKLAATTKNRYRDFFTPGKGLPAIFAYTGTAYRALSARNLTPADLSYANSHLLIGSFLYGLLKPLDVIRPYRLEGNVVLPGVGHQSLFDYWKPILTEWFINTVKNDDGTLVNLASNEFRQLFDWKKVCNELKVVSPVFQIDYGDKTKTVALYAKMCRGAMTRWIIQNRISEPEDLVGFGYDGFTWTSGYNFVMRQ